MLHLSFEIVSVHILVNEADITVSLSNELYQR